MKFHERHVDVHASSTWADNITRKHNLKKEPTEADMGEIAICVNCTETKCYGSCQKIKKYRKEHFSNIYRVVEMDVPEDLEKRVKAGLKNGELAKIYDVSTNTVYRWKRKLGLVKKRGGNNANGE